MSATIDLRAFSIFAGLSDAELELLAEVARERRYQAGQKIIEKDDTGASLFLVRNGKVSVVLPKPGGDDVQLGLLDAGEFFGEMSLFDGKPRSAVVVAEVDTTVLEIHRDRFLEQIRQNPDIALQVLSVMAERLRYSDDRTGELADRVYHVAYPRIDDAIKSQLEAAKVIYEKTEDRAGRVLAEVERNWTALTRLVSIVIGFASIAVGVLAFLGYTEINDARTRIKESVTAIQEQRAAAQELVADISTIKQAAEDAGIAKRDASAAVEIVLAIGTIRREFDLDRRADANAVAVDDSDTTQRLAIQFGEAERHLYRTYLEDYASNSADVVREAAVTYIDLLKRTAYRPDPAKFETTIKALLYALDQIDGREWRERRAIRQALVDAAEVNQKAWRYTLVEWLQRHRDSAEEKSRSQVDVARVLLEIDAPDSRSVEILRTEMTAGRSVWSRLQAAALLIRADEEVAWPVLLTHIGSMGQDSFVAAYTLAQIGPDKLREYGICKHRDLVKGLDPIGEIAARLTWQVENVFTQGSHNPYQRKYTEILAAGFYASSPCPTSSAGS